MTVGAPRRRAVLFLTLVALPAMVLLATTLRLVRQERELAVQRQAEARALLAVRLGQELRGRLERLRATGEPTAAIVARIDATSSRYPLPWQVRPVDSPAPPAAYRRLLAEGARAEFRERRPESAAALYRRAAAAAGAGAAALRQDARLLEARALRAAGRTAAALAVYREVAAQPLSMRDAEGVPLAFYAADALLAAGDTATATPPVAGAMAAEALPPTALYAARELAGQLGARALHQQLDSVIAGTGRLLTLQRELPALLARAARPGVPRTEPVWLPYGPEPWLVGVAVEGSPDAATIVVARAAPLLEAIAREGGSLAAAAARARLSADAAGEALGVAELNAEFPAGFPPAARAPGGTLLLLLPVVFALLLFTAYLLWRDVRREVAAAELRSQFVSSVSHELKTPLTSIRMFAEMLRTGRSPGSVRDEYLDIVVNESERLSRLINNVLDFSRLERGARRYRCRPVLLGDVVREAARAMAYPLAQDGFLLELTVDDALPPVSADADAIVQAVLNLLSNAMKFSGGSRRIALSVGREGGTAVIRVRDHGCGVEPDERRAIFERYYRGRAAQSGGVPGAGIGLALVTHVAAGHGGTIELDSEPGQGSTFSLRLPLAPAPAPVPAALARA